MLDQILTITRPEITDCSYPDALPAVLTNDVVWRVVALGPDVSKYAIGDLVVYHPAFNKPFFKIGFQKQALADLDFSAKFPEGFTGDDGATLPTNVIAPLVALFDAGNLAFPAPWTDEAKDFDYKSKTLLIMGGGSNCG